MKLNLNQYPAAIAQAALNVNELDYQIAEAQRHVSRLEGNADMVVAFEASLKNDNQRKARRFEVLQVNPEYERAIERVMRLTTEKANALARLEHLRNEFGVSKLEARLSLVQKLTGLDEVRELVEI